MTHDNARIARRTFLGRSSLMAAGLSATFFSAKGYSAQDDKSTAASRLERYNPKTAGGCAVSLGYDVDMPTGDAYLYDRSLGWQGRAHGHLNDDIRKYVRTLASHAEDFDAKLEFFVQGNTFEVAKDAALWTEIAGRGHAIDSHM